jgi:hypothetical protein
VSSLVASKNITFLGKKAVLGEFLTLYRGKKWNCSILILLYKTSIFSKVFQNFYLKDFCLKK